jgi:hypothetical protein
VARLTVQLTAGEEGTHCAGSLEIEGRLGELVGFSGRFCIAIYVGDGGVFGGDPGDDMGGGQVGEA